MNHEIQAEALVGQTRSDDLAAIANAILAVNDSLRAARDEAFDGSRETVRLLNAINEALLKIAETPR